MDKENKNYSVLLLIGLCTIPIIFWYTTEPIEFRFSGLMSALTSIGQISGLVGTVLFSFSMIIAARFKFIEKFFISPAKIYPTHCFISGLSLIMLLIHPLVLAIKYIPLSTNLAAKFLLPDFNDWAKTYGVIALVLMIILIYLTYFRKPRHNVWKISHRFLGLAIFLAGLHVYLIPSDVSRSTSLRVYMLGVIILGLASGICRMTARVKKI
jgi:predicted ferric reductase